MRAEKPACFRLSRRVRGESGLADLACGEDVLVVAQARGECAPGGIFLLDPWQLATLGQAPRADARLVAVAGATICGLSAGGELACFDAADRAAPVLGASLRAGAATALAVDEADLVLGWPEGGITVLSLPFEPAAAPRAALALGSAPVMALALGSGAAGRFLYAALDDGEELIVIDMDNPSGPAVVRRVAAPAAVHLAASGETLLLTARGAKPGGLYLFDLLDPAAPRLDARIPLQGCRAAALLGRRLFALTADEEGSDQAMLRVWSRDS
ncbi:MAG: hypothetical protein HY812_09260 [Planctomycetes bacterium]|nr:hypothetical protein [Planctomycetota bacterium]